MRTSAMVAGLLSLTTFASACDGGEALGPAEEWPLFATGVAREGADPAVIGRFVELYNAGMNGAGWALANEIYTPGAVLHTPQVPGLPPVTDLASMIAANPPGMVEDFQLVLEDVFVAGDRAVGRFTASAKWALGVPAPMPYVNPWIVIFRFENGRIAEEWWEFDLLGTLEQVGFLSMTRPAYGWSAPSAVTGEPGIPQQNASLARRAVQFVNTGNTVLADHVLSPLYVNHDPAFPMATDRSGLEHTIVDVVRAAFPDVRLTIDDLVASGDRVAVRFTFRGTHLGAFAGIPATGRRVEFTNNTIYRIADRQIVEGWSVWDAASLLQQLMAP
jgi:predicted ester cyclase